MPEDEKTITELFKNQESLPNDDINLSLEQMELSARKFGDDDEYCLEKSLLQCEDQGVKRKIQPMYYNSLKI